MGHRARSAAHPARPPSQPSAATGFALGEPRGAFTLVKPVEGRAGRAVSFRKLSSARPSHRV